MKMEKLFSIGDSHNVQMTVSRDNVAQKTGEGSLTQLLGTPALIDMMINAAVELIDPKLDDGFISVGKKTSVTHEHPSVIGETVTLKVEIRKIKHHHIQIQMTAWDELGVIATGKHLRTIVNDAWLMIKIKNQREHLENQNF